MGDRDETVDLDPVAVASTRVTVRLEAPILSGLVLIDSPGIAEHASFNRLVADTQDTVDAYIFILSATHFLSESEAQLLGFLLRNLHGDRLFIVVNKFDFSPDEEDELERTRRGCLRKLQKLYESCRPAHQQALPASPLHTAEGAATFDSSFKSFQTRRIFFTSARNALAKMLASADSSPPERLGVQVGIDGFADFRAAFDDWRHGPVVQRRQQLFVAELNSILKKLQFYLSNLRYPCTLR
eukprot:NODE_2713_length_752_cov_157.486486_g1903_i0.p1 GENE.NODE_2713_length_752_cov_157.486486_g1903_i0~~NODE_2713_length_752_cov_157.486486_g1903_i0.p1  ORF type:complete len:249 (-),score=81.68 NODE_2713_length_752_cov_157.486486_g1903_i0:5-727(-)